MSFVDSRDSAGEALRPEVRDCGYDGTRDSFSDLRSLLVPLIGVLKLGEMLRLEARVDGYDETRESFSDLWSILMPLTGVLKVGEALRLEARDGGYDETREPFSDFWSLVVPLLSGVLRTGLYDCLEMEEMRAAIGAVVVVVMREGDS